MRYTPSTEANLNGAAASPNVPRGRVWGNRPRLVIDIILAVSFLALMSVNLTGLLIHEWWGIGLMLLVIVHLLSQWDWTISSSRTFFSRLTQRIRVTYVLNWALFIAGVLVFFSGLVISENALPALGLSLGTRGGTSLFGFWHQMHTLSADAVLILAGIHLGLNWRWVLNAMKQVLRIGGRRGGANPARPAGVEA
jgi:Domain of unknown function (DUF4405)